MKIDFNTIITLISFVCMVASIIGAGRSNFYAKKAKALSNRDAVKSSLGVILKMKGYIDCIRNYKNPSLCTKPPRGQNIEFMINAQLTDLKKQFNQMINNFPSKYEEMLSNDNADKTDISKIISHMLSNSDEVTNDTLDEIESYLLCMEKELKKSR